MKKERVRGASPKCYHQRWFPGQHAYSKSLDVPREGLTAPAPWSAVCVGRGGRGISGSPEIEVWHDLTGFTNSLGKPRIANSSFLCTSVP
jgi:hypothetical protein